MQKGIKAFFWTVKDFLTSSVSKPIKIIASQNGKLYEVRESPIGRFVSETDYVKELDPVQEGFEYRLPKIPGRLLEQILTFFRYYSNDEWEHEVMVMIYYDLVEKHYYIDCPKQKVSKERIDADDVELRYSERHVCVMHIHSHNTMPAIFSGLDNQNEKAFMLYTVVGRLDNTLPQITMRVGANGRYFKLDVADIFESPDYKRDRPYPLEWHNRVSVLN